MDTVNGMDMENFCETSEEKAEKQLECPNLSANLETNSDNIVDNNADVQEESFTDENYKSPIKNSSRKRDLINQSLSLPYFKLSRPDFHEFTQNVGKNLEVYMKGDVPESENTKVIKESSSRKKSFSTPPSFMKHQDEIARLKQSQYERSFLKNECVGDKNFEIVLCEGPPMLKSARSAPNNTTKESYKFSQQDFIQQLKDQMQKKKEAAFDRHKEIQLADEEIYGSDLEDDDNSNSSTPSVIKESTDMEIEQEISESAVKCNSIEDQHNLRSSDEEPCENNFDDSDGSMDSPPVSLSLPSYQPNGGFVDENDVSSDSCSLDENKVPIENESLDEEKMHFESKILDRDDHLSFGTSSSPLSFPIKNTFDLDSSQVPLFGLDDVSTICSGRFLSVDEERPWTPSSDSQLNKSKDSDARCNNDESRCDTEELKLEKSQLKEFDSTDNPDYSALKRKILDNDDAAFSPPLKKYRKDPNLSEIENSPSSLKIHEIMEDVSSSTGDASQDVCLKFHTEKNSTDLNSDQKNSETLEDEDIDEKQFFPRVRKCRPIVEDSDDDEEENLSYNDQPIEEIPQNQVNDLPKPLKMNDFFDEEAQLSGEEMSSDESEGEEGDDEAEEELIVEDIPAEEELKEQVANIYFKHEQDDDARMVKRLQQDFLPEGELYVDGGGRQKTFHWSNNTTNNISNEVLSESDPEDNVEYPMQQDKIKWRQETSVQKAGDSDSSDVESKQEILSSKKLPVSIIGRVISSRTTHGVNEQVRSSPITRHHGSLIHIAGSEGLNLNVPTSVQRKTVLFQTLTQSDKGNAGTSHVKNGKSVFEKLM